MARLRRPNGWYDGWMNNPDEKLAEARNLEEAIGKHQMDSQTLEELTLILDHDCLCAEVAPNRLALRPQEMTELIRLLADCRFQSVHPSTDFEREFQFRGLLSALALQKAQGVTAFESDYYVRLRTQFEDRFKELQWQHLWDSSFSPKKFRQVQCSYLLQACAEYATNFGRAEPAAVTGLRPLVDVMVAGAPIAMGAPSNLRDLIAAVDDLIRPFTQTPDVRYTKLFVLQDLTRMVRAHHLQSRVGKNGADGLVKSEDLARDILQEILLTLRSLRDYDQFEQNASAPPALWDGICALIGRGLPNFRRYHFVYGLLDCATQLRRILPDERVHSDFKTRMKEILECQGAHRTLRWKAIEFLLSSPSGPTARLDQDVVLSAEVRKEIGAMRHCLCEEEGLSPLSSPTPELSPLSSQVSLNLAIAEEIVSAQWMEIPQPPPASGDSSTFKVTLDRHSYDSAGLSPDCQAAYFLSERRVVVISLPADMNGGQPEGRSSWTLFPSVFRKDSPKPFHSLLQRKSSKPDPEYAGAAISERFLALFTQSTLQLYLYRRQTSSRQDGWATSLEVGWYATCIALYEEDNRAWVAIGRRGDSRAGSIKMYQIDIDNDNVTVKPHTARFDQSNPNPLRREYPKTVAFGPDGRRLVCVTSNDNVLAWLLSNNARPRRDPFVIQKTFRRQTNARGLTSATLFHSRSERPYVLCTTSRSTECANNQANQGEWSFISPVASGPTTVPPAMETRIWKLGKAKAIVAGAASASADVVALLKENGRLLLFEIAPQEGGGLEIAGKPIPLAPKLVVQHPASPTCLRFYHCKATHDEVLVAVDTEGTVITKRFALPSTNDAACSVLASS